jgi:hypothetical protein
VTAHEDPYAHVPHTAYLVDDYAPVIPLRAQHESDEQRAAADGGLAFQRLDQLCAEVDAMPPTRYLVRGIWPADAYGVLGAEKKAGKSWSVLDLALSVASGTPWLGAIPIDTTGPVVVLAGEGGKRNIVRRLRAIAAARGVHLESLPIIVCVRAPNLVDQFHIDQLAQVLAVTEPRLVILDPLYLSARGANGADLYAMGDVLRRPQRLCEDSGAAFQVVTHFNRGAGKGAERFTGAGPAEWGRVLIACAVLSRHTDPDTLATTTLTEWEITGGEIPDQRFRVRRTIRAVDPDDLESPLVYDVALVDDDPAEPSGLDLPPAAAKLLEALTDEPAGARTLTDRVAAAHGHGLKRETVSRSLNDLARRGLAECFDPGPGREKLWRRSDPSSGV